MRKFILQHKLSDNSSFQRDSESIQNNFNNDFTEQTGLFQPLLFKPKTI